MGFFDRHDRGGGPTPGSPEPRSYDVVDKDGHAVRYASDDFDEIFSTTDEKEMHRLVGIGWLVLDETVGVGEGPEHLDLEARAQGGGTGDNPRTVPVWRSGDDVVHYVLGLLKDGAVGTPRP